MTRLLALLLLLALAPAASAQRSTAPAAPDAVAQIYADLARGDVEAVVAVLDPHVVWVEGPHSLQVGRHVGSGTVAARVLRPQVGAPAFVPDMITVEGDRVVAVGTRRRTHPATGQLITTRFRHEWRLADGRVTGVDRADDGPDLSAAALCGAEPC
ncbi:nuclear transport factor 2 family protein [Rubrivirga marina]|uniref:SnoaL-like domain-containing protein n=1 Tax=Rubrivirga marina TaxID=1196024 RepID=A0A271IWF5_9BACT|nr:nuclear transport factor 2 family protein [Rubrivirga marina]PAP75460.1 hypothetical protein BSZ37_02865 [Rubrivirga marina]